MSTLKELTQENHRKAERSAFVGDMMRNQLTAQQWVNYLLWKRDLLVVLDRKLGLTELHFEFNRSSQFDTDIVATGMGPTGLTATLDYIKQIESITNEQAWAHVYVHYLGDLRGGQMLKKMVKQPMHHVDYDDATGLETIIRANVSDALADEANVGFDLTMQAMEEIML